MFDKKIVLLVLILFHFKMSSCADNCRGKNCTRNEDTMDIPLTDKLEAPLKAELDIALLNKQLRRLIKREVKQAVVLAMKDMMETLINEKMTEAGITRRLNNSDTTEGKC